MTALYNMTSEQRAEAGRRGVKSRKRTLKKLKRNKVESFVVGKWTGQVYQIVEIRQEGDARTYRLTDGRSSNMIVTSQDFPLMFE